MPCNPLLSSKGMQDPKEWGTENWEMQRKLCFQRVDQISSNGLKLQAWMFLAEPAFLRLIPSPGWNKAVSVTGISLFWFSHLNFKACCRWHFFPFFSTKLSQSCLEIILQRVIDHRSVALTFKGQRNHLPRLKEPPLSCDVGQHLQSLVQRLMLWAEPGVVWRWWFLLCLGVAVSQPWLLLYRCFFLYLLFFLFCTFIDF